MKQYPELECYTSTKLCHINGVSIGSTWIDINEYGPSWSRAIEPSLDLVNVINHNGRFSVIRHWGCGTLEISRRRRHFTDVSLELVSLTQASKAGSCQLIGVIDYTASRPLFNVRAIIELNAMWLRVSLDAVLCIGSDPGSASAVIITNTNGELNFELK